MSGVTEAPTTTSPRSPCEMDASDTCTASSRMVPPVGKWLCSSGAGRQFGRGGCRVGVGWWGTWAARSKAAARVCVCGQGSTRVPPGCCCRGLKWMKGSHMHLAPHSNLQVPQRNISTSSWSPPAYDRPNYQRKQSRSRSIYPRSITEAPVQTSNPSLSPSLTKSHSTPPPMPHLQVLLPQPPQVVVVAQHLELVWSPPQVPARVGSAG